MKEVLLIKVSIKKGVLSILSFAALISSALRVFKRSSLCISTLGPRTRLDARATHFLTQSCSLTLLLMQVSLLAC